MNIKAFFVLLYVGTLLAAVSYLWCANPEVMAARLRSHKGTKRWDRILLCFLLPPVYAIFLVAALDRRFHWLSVPWWVCGIGYVLFLVGLGIITWALAVNQFFEAPQGLCVFQPGFRSVLPRISAATERGWTT